MEAFVKIIIYIHAFFGGIGLIAGFATLIFKKGSKNHKRFGKIFSYSMVLSSLIPLGVCLVPNHENPFLFLIGIFTIYLVLSGNRVLLFKKKEAANLTDKLISVTLFVGAVVMLILGGFYLIQSGRIGVLYVFFGLLALFLAWRDYKFYKSIDKTKILKFHIGKMTGAFTASITAFLVAGIQLNGLIYWLMPSLFAGLFIMYWNKKLAKQKGKSVSFNS